MDTLGQIEKDRMGLIAGTIKRASDETGADLVPEEQAWLRGVLDAVLSFSTKEEDQVGEPTSESITLAFGSAMLERSGRVKAQRLAALGKESLLRSGGIGVSPSQFHPTRILFYREMASTAFAQAADLDPLVDAQSLMLPETLPTEGLILDPAEIDRSIAALRRREQLIRDPWLFRIAGKVPELSRVIKACRADLLRDRTSDLFLIGTDPMKN